MQTLHIPRTIQVGGGARHQAGERLRELGVQRALLVTDPGVLALGLHADAVASCEALGIELACFDGVQPDPTDDNVHAGLAAVAAHQADGLLAIGGGSAMDAAKVIAVAARQTADLPSWMGIEHVPGPGLPLLCLPTTAGTGAEVTKVAVITNTARAIKMMMLSRHLLPTVALVDHELSHGMPPALTAAVGVDTLTHGIEAYVSRKAGPLTDPLALSCVRLCGQYLKRAWRDGSDAEARAGMQLAACQGGMAFANSSVALVHGMSRPIGAMFHLSHGLSNAVLLPTVTAWSLAGAPERYAEVARVLGVAEAGDDDAVAGHRLVTALSELNQRLGIPRLGESVGGDRAHFDTRLAKMAVDALASGSPANNPRVPVVDEVVALYETAW